MIDELLRAIIREEIAPLLKAVRVKTDYLARPRLQKSCKYRSGGYINTLTGYPMRSS
jgi:hypothetical protein